MIAPRDLTIVAAVTAALLAIAVLSRAHGLEGVPDPPGSELCVCSAAIDAEGIVSPCATGSWYSAERRSIAGQPGPEPKLLAIVRLERLLARLRQELAEGR